MENPIFPYGPTPTRLDPLVRSLASQPGKLVTLDYLEKLGIPKTQVTIALSGLKQLGFVSPDGAVTDLCKKFSVEETRAEACDKVIRRVYHPLVGIVEANPASAQLACHSYLQRLGRGDSAREKILKLFWFFWRNSGRKHPEEDMKMATSRTSSTLREVLSLDGDGTRSTVLPESPIGGQGSGTEAQEHSLSVDAAAIKLAETLLAYCDSRERVLAEKRAQLYKLQEECTQLEAEIGRVREMISKHLESYPGLATLLRLDQGVTGREM